MVGKKKNMAEKIKISLDFDGTLTEKRVQEIIQKLPENLVTLYIVTSRLGNIQRMEYPNLKSNEDIYELAEQLGIPAHRISYTNQQEKWMVLNKSGVKIHIDDDIRQVDSLNWYGIVKTFDANAENLEEDLFEYIEALQNF